MNTSSVHTDAAPCIERAAAIPTRRLRAKTLTYALALIAATALGACASAPPKANSGRVVVIAGASSGFGKGVAMQLAEQGAHLVLAARRTALLEELAQECRSRGARALVVPTDVAREDEVKRLADAAVSEFGRIDVWINMAGVGAIGRFTDIPLADHHRLIDVNVNGVLTGSYYAMQQFERQEHGTLINIASVAGRVPAIRGARRAISSSMRRTRSSTQSFARSTIPSPRSM